MTISQKKYPLAESTICREEIKNLCQWLLTEPKLTQGGLVKEFEQKYSKYIGRKYCIFVNSGSSANLLMYYSAFLTGKLGNITAVPACGWSTTISPFLQFNLDVEMIGPDKTTWGIDLNHLEDFCKKNINPSCVFVQVLGVPHHREIEYLKEKYNLFLFEDSCAAQGAYYIDDELRKKNVGCLGDMSSFSFYFGHQMSTIEGGMVCTDDYELYQIGLMVRNHGWQKDLDEPFRNDYFQKNGVENSSSFNFLVPGFNLRSSDVQAYLGIQQLKNIREKSAKRTKNHYSYASKLEGKFKIQDWGRNVPSSIHFGIVCEDTEQRNIISKKLIDNRIEIRFFDSANLGRHPFWYSRKGIFENKMADNLYECGLFLPNNPQLTEEDISYICDTITERG